MTDPDYLLEQDDLVERYSTPLADMTPEVRQRVLATEAWARAEAAAGRFAAPHPLLDDNRSPGLDETNGYRPYPLTGLWIDRFA